MKYLLILFVVALALAPLSHFFPNKRQRKVARMREYAAVHGLFVEFRDLPARSARSGDPARRESQVIYYGKRLPPSRDRVRPRLAWLREDEDWSGLGHRQAAPAAAGLLPAAVQALGVDEASCGIYWQEQGEEAEVADIVAALEQWADKLGTGR